MFDLITTTTLPQEIEKHANGRVDLLDFRYKFTDVRIPVRGLGEVMLVDFMGGDDAVVQAARVSYGAGTKKVSEDKGLIRYLMAHRHTTPFEMAEIKLRVRCPMDVWRQWIRHRTATGNEYSTRYSIAIDETAVTDPAEWRKQSGHNKQGSEGHYGEELGQRFSDAEAELQALARQVYYDRITEFGRFEAEDNKEGVAREQARKDLPLSTFTEAYWKTDLHNLLGFLSLRCDSHAQLEIRAFAQAIAYIVQFWVPWTWEAFMDHRLYGMHLSRKEVEVMRELLKVKEEINQVLQGELDMSKREMAAFKDKVKQLTGE